MTYDREEIMAQIYVAFGQGTGILRVSRGACAALAARYGTRIDEDIAALWESVAVQVLERMRAIGRAAAAEASLAGRTAISGDVVRKAAARVETLSATPLCPPDGEAETVRGREAQTGAAGAGA
jgi:hypothetical protein